MNLQNHIVFINGVNKTYNIESIEFDGYKYAIRFKNSDKTYTYAKDKIEWLTNPVLLDVKKCHIFVNGKREKNIKTIHLFSSSIPGYYAVAYNNGFIQHYSANELEIRRSCLLGRSAAVLDYLRRCVGINAFGVDVEDESSEGILSSIYSKIDFVDETTAASVYMNPEIEIKQSKIKSLLLPFGCNASQEAAVKKALSNQISVIQGPPGTGKTQTILNIIANLIVANKTVLIVSHNNHAIENVLEKLNTKGFGFLVAPLGNKENKETFISNQPPLNPELPLWHKTVMELNNATVQIKTSLESLEALFEMQEKLALCRQELAEVEVEMVHYKQNCTEDIGEKEIKIASSRILRILERIRDYDFKYQCGRKGVLRGFRKIIDKLNLEFQYRFLVGIKDNLTPESLPSIVARLDWLFYLQRIREIKFEIKHLEEQLSQLDAEALIKSLTDTSMLVLKATIAQRYNKERSKIGSVKDLFNEGESVLADYPIVLSTTFSSKTCFNSDTLFDYVIMDEASQVSVETGLLSLTCARNAVIVGDTMQLSNIVKEVDRAKLEEIRLSCNIPECYSAANHSFLSSVLETITNVPETLLREHYRCHPDIINFCNQKFYGGQLIIMTKRRSEENPLLLLTTVPGNHCRGQYNQREIDAVKVELIPLLDNPKEIGIIAPYNKQVDQFHLQIPLIEAATVHKYQGREKDTIIMSVTDDIITEFVDQANLINVAVSRAKHKFCLVVTGNQQELRGNINDLISYIKYQKGTVINSKLSSIYDYLCSQKEKQKREQNVKNISQYDSENLTFDLIEKIRKCNPLFSHIKALCNYPLRYLIKDTSGLSVRELEYAMHPSTHIDFLIINRVTKEPLLAIETDGFSFHNERMVQFERDRLKDKILELYELPFLRLSTIGYGEEHKIINALNSLNKTSVAI